MAERKHTPGPWTHVPVETSDDHRIVYCLIGPEVELSKKRRGVAYAGTYGKTRKLTTSGVRLSDEECEANARLIAAAPDMKQALEDAYAFILDQYSDPKAEALEGEPISAEARPVFRSICDALAKSEGDT